MAEVKVTFCGGLLDGKAVIDPGHLAEGNHVVMKTSREVYVYHAAREGAGAELHFVGHGDPTFPGNHPAAAAALMDALREPYLKLVAALAELDRASDAAPGGFPTGVIRIGRWEVRRVGE